METEKYMPFAKIYPMLVAKAVCKGGHRDRSLDPQHPITDADVRLYVLLPIFPVFQLFAQGCHEYAQRSNIIFPTAAPNLLRNVGVCQNLTNIFLRAGTTVCIRWVLGAVLHHQDMRSLPHSRFSAHRS